MDSLTVNFIKRAIIVPLIAALLTAALLVTAGPRITAKSEVAKNNETTQVQSLDLTGYSVKSYKTFKQLKSGDLAATIKCDNIGFGEKAVVFDISDKRYITMNKASSEPWNNGGVLFMGNNTSEQFKELHAAQKGDEFVVSFYDNNAYTYKLKKIIPCATAKELTSYIKDNTLVLCLQYNDFKDLGNSYYYQVYIAEMV